MKKSRERCLKQNPNGVDDMTAIAISFIPESNIAPSPASKTKLPGSPSGGGATVNVQKYGNP